jgi:group I intron endonuclease
VIVYAITNLINGKRYIGITEESLKRRWSQHTYYARRGAPSAIHRAMKKHGVENFAIVELARLAKGSERAILCEMERFWIAQERTLTPNGYNMTPGGDGLPKGEKNPNVGRKASPEKIAKMRAGWTPERRAQAAETMREIRARPGHVEKLAAGVRSEKAKVKAAAAWTPERRVEAAKRMLRNTKVRKISVECAAARDARIVALAKSEKLRKANSERMKKFMADCSERNARHPEWNAQRSETMKKRWAEKRSTLQ